MDSNQPKYQERGRDATTGPMRHPCYSLPDCLTNVNVKGIMACILTLLWKDGMSIATMLLSPSQTLLMVYHAHRAWSLIPCNACFAGYRGPLNCPSWVTYQDCLNPFSDPLIPLLAWWSYPDLQERIAISSRSSQTMIYFTPWLCNNNREIMDPFESDHMPLNLDSRS